jgi:hypothetical protein
MGVSVGRGGVGVRGIPFGKEVTSRTVGVGFSVWSRGGYGSRSREETVERVVGEGDDLSGEGGAVVFDGDDVTVCIVGVVDVLEAYGCQNTRKNI